MGILKQIETVLGSAYGLTGNLTTVLNETGSNDPIRRIIDIMDQAEVIGTANLDKLAGIIEASEDASNPNSVAAQVAGALERANTNMLAEIDKVMSRASRRINDAADNQAAAASRFGIAVNNFGGWVNAMPENMTVNVTFQQPEVNV
jgi:hypothetical protein